MIGICLKNFDNQIQLMGCQWGNQPTIVPKRVGKTIRPKFLVQPSITLLKEVNFCCQIDDKYWMAQKIQLKQLQLCVNTGGKDFQTLGMRSIRSRASGCLQVWLCFLSYNKSQIYEQVVNVQNAKGQNLITLAAMYRAYECFDILLQFGGMSLKSRDFKGRSVITRLFDYKCPDMAHRIEHFHKQIKAIPMGLSFDRLKPRFNIDQQKIKAITEQFKNQHLANIALNHFSQDSNEFKYNQDLFLYELASLQEKLDHQLQAEAQQKDVIYKKRIKRQLSEFIYNQADGYAYQIRMEVSRLNDTSSVFFKGELTSSECAQLTKAIQLHDLYNFASFLHSKGKDIHCFSIANTLWSIPMLCTRFDSCACLKYFIKSIIYQQGQEVLLACLDVCDKQNRDIISLIGCLQSKSCFDVLLQFGGFKTKSMESFFFRRFLEKFNYRLCGKADRMPLTQNSQVSRFDLLIFPNEAKDLAIAILNDEKVTNMRLGLVAQDYEQVQMWVNQQQKLLNSQIQYTQSLHVENECKAKQINYQLINLQEFPQEIKEQVLWAKQNRCQYLDHTFKPDKTSLVFGLQSFQLRLQEIQWARAQQIFPGTFSLFDGISVQDIQQGTLSICYFLAVIGSLSLSPQRIQRLFKNKKNQIGIYIIKFYPKGVESCIIVDDYFPVNKFTKMPIFTRPNGRQIWSLLLEKALCKYCQSYLSAQLMAVQHIMEDILGAPSYSIYTGHVQKNYLFDVIEQACNKKYVVVGTTSGQFQEGLISDHAFSVLGTKRLPKSKRSLIKIRNPYTRLQFNGQFGDSSAQWTGQLLAQMQHRQQSDGIFYMTIEEYYKFFQATHICYYQENYHRNFIQFSSNRGQLVTFSLRIQAQAQVNVRLIQPLDRSINDKRYLYSDTNLALISESGKLIGKHIGTHRNRAKTTFPSCNVFQSLKAGVYFVGVKAEWILQKYNSAVIVVYSSQEVTLEKAEVHDKFSWL